MSIVNLTPHPITLLSKDNEVVMTLPKGEVVPRLSQATNEVGIIEGITITETQFGEIQDLPDSQEGVFLIVSRLVLAACPNRQDLLVPNELVRDDKGHIVGCKSLARN